jgi:hypothetical protein
MATGGAKKSTAPAAKPAAAPKIPTVIAKPAAPAPATKSSGAAPKGGGKAATGTKLVPSTPSGKSSGKSSNQAAIDKLFKDINKNFETLKGLGKTLTGGDIIDEDTKEDTTETKVEDAGLAYAKMQDEKARQDAFALLKDVFNSYGLPELATEIEGYMKQGIGSNQATILLKQSNAYKERFQGNELRRAAGLNVISEAEYLDLENSYSETLKAYGLQDYFGVGVTPNERKNRQKAIADVIGKDISAVEFKDRVSTAVDRVKMADPATKSAFQQFYGIGEADLARYFLDPTRALVTLKEKATAAEIGGAAIGQGLPATAASAEDLARFGISREQAQVGYSVIADELPTATKLGEIYKQEGITYNQAEAEQATFKQLASAKRKKEQLVEREKAAFQGSSGVAPAGLKTTYLRQSSSAGYF